MIFLSLNTFGQGSFGIEIEPVTISGLPGLQSFAWGKHDGKWLILGGRNDGLHRRQPFASFSAAGNNTKIIVVDPAAKKYWSATLSGFSASVMEQMQSTNMQFHQEDSILYITGGYGYSATAADHITYPYLTAVNVPRLMRAVIGGTTEPGIFRQVNDEKFRVTGAHMKKIDSTWYIVGGQNFEGRYNPMGPNQGPGFTQIYINQARMFHIRDNGSSLQVSHAGALNDTLQLHRRDYNVMSQIMPDGKEGITAFSGVFQRTADIPYLNCVNITASGLDVRNDFSQYYNHYHCATIPMYDAAKNEMHNLFFGGIAQYYDSAGILVQDNNVPFTKTIARVTRTADGKLAEYKLPAEMPGFLGSGSEFIPADGLPMYSNEVIKYSELAGDTVVLGYIYGGISSSAKNIFWINTGTESSASSNVFRVKLIRSSNTGIHTLNPQSNGSLQLQVYPNPNDGEFSMKFQLAQAGEVTVSIFDLGSGKTITDKCYYETPGSKLITRRIRKLEKGGVYLLTLRTANETAVQKVIVEP